NGESPERLSELLKEDGFLITDNIFKRRYGIEHMKDFIGKRFANNFSSDTLTLRAAYKPIRYDDYSSLQWSASIMAGVGQEDYNWMTELVVRVKDNMDKDFIEKLMKDADSHFRVGNYYIASIQSFDDIREIHQRDYVADMRMYFTGSAFLALNIFLGLLGTFWFRTRQRIPEIAIRKANGANRIDIFKRVIGEGELLLLLITPFAIAFDYLLAHYELNTFYQGGYFVASRFIACVAISWCFMALMIFFGTLLPANRAMHIAPAKALMGNKQSKPPNFMKIIRQLMLLATLAVSVTAGAAGDAVRVITLDDAIIMARTKSVDAAVALNELRTSYWTYRTYRA
ncbi:MAG: ABC transporter permease, partial [Duncaniella sp.]|nr:ABC transporter permease [Duncaniella sp.]